MDKAIVFTHNLLAENFAKTCHGLLRGTERFEIISVIDAAHEGKDAGTVLNGSPLGIPVHSSIAQFFKHSNESPEFCIVGVAFPGGVLPEDCRKELLAAMDHGLSIVCGLHHYLSEDPEFQISAKNNGVKLIDIRKPRPVSELHFWTGKILEVTTPVIAILGSDCAVGKRTTARFIMEVCRNRGIKTEMIYTGQTGWMQGYSHGFIFDATPNDFVSGEIERVVLECVNVSKPDLILLEGQSSLRNPSGPCGSEFLLSGNAKGVVLIHPPGRKHFVDMEELGFQIPDIEDEIGLIQKYGSKVIGVGLNEEGCDMGQLRSAQRTITKKMNIPVVLPLTDGVNEIVDGIQTFMNK